MATHDTTETGQSGTGMRVLHGVETGSVFVRKVAMIAVLVLIGVWLTGRVVEIIHGQTVFDLHLIYLFGISIWIGIAVYLAGATIASIENIRKSRNKRSLVIPWIFFLLLVSIVLVGLQGFRISSMGLFATAAGLSESAKQASFLLFKYHPLNPMLPVNLLAAKVSGMALDVGSMASFIWDWNNILLFLIWSVAYGIVLLMSKIEIGQKIIHLFLSAGGLIALIIMKSMFPPTKDQMIFLYAAALLLFMFQILLTYSCLRLRANGTNEDASETETRAFGLPPSAVKIVLIVFIMVPILADLQNQLALVHP